jgi:S-adenosyl-L-methionine hydrolase (adenosine-forming)
MGKKNIPCIALLTDFGLQDQYIASMKGVIASLNSSVRIIDITHSIQPYRICQAAYVLWSSYNYFPKDTVFVNVVDPGVGSNRRILVMKSKNYTFIAPDNGIMDFVLYQEKIATAIEVTSLAFKKFSFGGLSQTFHGRDLLAPIAAYIANKIPIQRFGKSCQLPEIFSPFVISRTDVVPVSILHIDHYGNIITNIRLQETERCKKELQAVSIGGKRVSRWARFYDEAPENTACLIEGSNGLIEISAKKNSAAHLLNAALDSKVKMYWR